MPVRPPAVNAFVTPGARARGWRSTSYAAMSRSLHLALGQREPQRLDEMQGCANCQACSPRVAGVPVDLGTYERDVKGNGRGPGSVTERWEWTRLA
jgi:hypothetical protein